MGGDMVAALGRATLDGVTLFGHNCRRAGRTALTLHRGVGRCHAPEERVETNGVVVPQARETYTAVGVQTVGQWGYHHGVNTWGVAAGCTRVRTRMTCDSPTLAGTDLVRLGLERSRTARSAVDHVTDFLSRYGQGTGAADRRIDSAFLFADASEAYVLETAGRYWVDQEVREIRAVSDVSTVRQDWDGIAPGFSGLAIEQGWWPADGSKVDFGGVAAAAKTPIADPFRRWGRATLLLEEQNGHVDLAFVRRVLSDHYEGCSDEIDPLRPRHDLSSLCPHGRTKDATTTGASLVVQLPREAAARIAWYCPGPPCVGVYLPLVLAGDIMEACGASASDIHDRFADLLCQALRSRSDWDLCRDSLGRLQARFDQEAEEFVAEAVESSPELGRRATLFMRHALERFEEAIEGLLQPWASQRATAGTPALLYP